MTTIIEIELDDGKVIKGQADFGKGSPANPMTDDELAEKFRGCARWAKMPEKTIDTVLDMLWHVEALKDVNELTKLLRA
jgi:2-methylcitrate dehydratase PrpD